MDSLRERLTQILAGYGHDYPNDITLASILAAIAEHNPDVAGLVERLSQGCWDGPTARGAATALTAQSARIAELEATLRPFAEDRTGCALGITATDVTQLPCGHCDDKQMPCFRYRRARAALSAIGRVEDGK